MNQTSSKQFAVIAGLVCVLALISFLLFYYGRQHKVIIDNRTVELPDGQSFRSLPGALVAVNHETLSTEEVTDIGASPAARPLISFKFWPSPDQSVAKAVEMMPRERIMVKVLGPSFNLKAEVRDKWDEPEKTIDVNIHLGTRRDGMVRLVKLAGDLPEPLEDFPNDSIRRPSEADEAEPSGDSEGAPPMETPALGDM
ncbi:hypothetical protein C4J81_12655 [Deltaproteobacteria bacterium Smac51]|nr:hypothetical protein C4J81_12655 [Deltaproteobacteria bacterium Smac51]